MIITCHGAIHSDSTTSRWIITISTPRRRSIIRLKATRTYRTTREVWNIRSVIYIILALYWDEI